MVASNVSYAVRVYVTNRILTRVCAHSLRIIVNTPKTEIRLRAV